MKKYFLGVMFACLGASGAYAQSFGNVLANNPTNHFELLVNNLNMLMLVKAEELREKSEESDDELKTKFMKVSATNDHKLVFTSIYEAPVALVSRAKCNEQLEEDFANMLGEDSPVPTLLQMVSYFKMTDAQASQMLRDSFLNINIHAAENPELSVSCGK
ncbi:hypothetical protein [uncultured Microbulbifer sp.]|uniref:hypothetical protein n=1 Tax=uncultured Microbulbifer sp. TaxID=348147 RepID=UPI0025FD53BD|nr:hypothetical protein [uncultured Microbulbifer sp.]